MRGDNVLPVMCEHGLSKNGDSLGVWFNKIYETSLQGESIAEQDWFRRLVPDESFGGQANPRSKDEDGNRKMCNRAARNNCSRGGARRDGAWRAWKLETCSEIFRNH